MIADFFADLLLKLLQACPVLSLPLGFSEAQSFIVGVVGFINVFLPLARLAPIVGIVILVRNWNIIVSLLRFILRFIPFIG